MEWHLQLWTWVCSRSWGWGTVGESCGGSFASVVPLLSPVATVQPSYPNPRRCESSPWAVASSLSMKMMMEWKMNADGVHVRTVVCCWDTVVWSWPAAGLVWCKSSWASSRVSPLAAGVLRTHDKHCCCLLLLLHCCRRCSHTGWRPTEPVWCWGFGPAL